MTPKIDMEVTKVLESINTLQKEAHLSSGKFYKVLKTNTKLSGLSYRVLNYYNPLQGAGYGVIFEYTDSQGVVYQKSVDVGFLDPDIILSGYHPIPETDWRVFTDPTPYV